MKKNKTKKRTRKAFLFIHAIIRLIDKDNNIINEVYFINDKININKNDNSLNNYHVPIDIKNLYGMNLSINKNNIKK